MKVRIASKGKFFQIVDLVVRKFCYKNVVEIWYFWKKLKSYEYKRFTKFLWQVNLKHKTCKLYFKKKLIFTINISETLKTVLD